MPIIQGQNANVPTDEFPEWGLVHFEAGRRNITELHYHDCDEFVFMIDGKCVMRSEGIVYTLQKGDEHELLEILEDTTYFWACTKLKGQKRRGHLHRRKEG
jgi:hypothetical protein